MGSVGLVGGAPFLVRACEEALDGLASVRPIEVLHRDDAVAVQAVLVATTFLLDHGVRWLESCRLRNGTLPIILLPAHEHADVGDELLRSAVPDRVLDGVVDEVVPIASIPTDLRASVLRQLDRGSEAPFQAPPLGLPARAVQNRRRCYRARPAPGTAAAIATLEGFEIDLAIEDLSIAARGAAGAVRLGCDPGLASLFELLAPGQSLPLRLQLARDDEPVDVRGGLVAGTVRRFSGGVCFAARYTAEDPRDARRIRSFWVRCQRHAVAEG